MTVQKEWTFEEAWAAQEEFQKAGGSIANPCGPFNQWTKLHELEKWQKAIKAGNKNAILEAVADCALAGLALPDWLATAYLNAWRSVRHYKAKSWDAAFGLPHRKGVQLASMRKKLTKSIHVWNEVNKHRKMGRAIDDELFAEVGNKLGLGLTLTKEYYGEWKRRRAIQST